MAGPQEFIVPWSGKSRNYTQDEINVVVAAMKKSDPQTQGKYQEAFERKFTTFFGVQHAFAVSSATSALELSALLTKLNKGDEVIIPAHTFAATAIPFARTGAKIVWADIDRNTRLVTADTIARCMTKKTRAVVVVHLYGLVADMDPILQLAKRKGLFVIEDVAQAPGARYKGKRAGSMGDFGCFSFHTHKNITTLGEGGMLTVKDSKRAKLVPGLRHNGMRGFNFKREKYWVPAMGDVDFDLDNVWPYNFCMGEIQSALGVKLLDRLDQINDQRRKRALKFIDQLKAYPELEFQSVPKDCEHVFHLLAARYNGSAMAQKRDDFIGLMAFKHKVKVIVQYCPLYRYPMFVKAGMAQADCPETDDFFDNMVSFPFHQWLTTKQVDYMLAATIKTLNELRRQK